MRVGESTTRRFARAAIALLAAWWGALPGHGAVLNLTDEVISTLEPATFQTTGGGTAVGGFINGALFRRPTSSDESGAGSGIFRDLYTVGDNSVGPGDPQEGYNRVVSGLDSSIPNGFDPTLRVSGLVPDLTGSAYVFVIDTNESGNATDRYLSLDDFRIYIGDSTDPLNLPQSIAELDAAFGEPAYAMSPDGEQNHILLDYSLYSGSGEMDLFVFVPQTVFAAADPDDYVYIYSSFGLYTDVAGFDPSAGSEQVSIPGKSIDSAVNPLVDWVPEPRVPMLLALALLLLLRRGRPQGGGP